MSWKSASEIMDIVIENIVGKMDPEDREILYKELIKYLEDADCDTLYECLNQDAIFDEVYKEFSSFIEEENESSDWDDQDNTTF